jgi:hypothetical protein
MSDVRQSVGTPVTADFCGIATPSACPPIVVSKGTGVMHTIASGDLVVAHPYSYVAGTWTPVDASVSGLGITVNAACYTQIGRQITAAATVTYPVTSGEIAAKLSGLPVAAKVTCYFAGSIYSNAELAWGPCRVSPATKLVELFLNTGIAPLNKDVSGKVISINVTYFT